eukprot:m.12521 g.12521  ORF g.12521 m.12521 type:complete len:53 (-) comp5831_c0_seq2:88-246(-)
MSTMPVATTTWQQCGSRLREWTREQKPCVQYDSKIVWPKRFHRRPGNVCDDG